MDARGRSFSSHRTPGPWVLALALVACSPPTQGLGNSGTGASGGAATGSTSDAPGSGPATTNGGHVTATSQGSDSASGASSVTGPASGTAGASSTGGVGSTTTGAGSTTTGAGSTTTGAGSTTTGAGSTTTGAGSTTTGGGALGLYEGPCTDSSECEAGLVCHQEEGGVDFMVVTGSFCTKSCNDDGDCPEAPSGWAAPFCGTGDICRLSCDPFLLLVCPQGMSCFIKQNDVDFCAYKP